MFEGTLKSVQNTGWLLSFLKTIDFQENTNMGVFTVAAPRGMSYITQMKVECRMTKSSSLFVTFKPC